MPPTPTKVRWEEMLPDELLEAIAVRKVCYAGYGLAEPHGPYSALGLDFIKAKGICEMAAEAHGAVVAPPFAWHIMDRPAFPWAERSGAPQTLGSAIPTDLFFRMVMHQIRCIDARGFAAAILITGHYGGVERDLRLVAEFYLRRTGSPLRITAIADNECMTFENYRGDHGGITETAQLHYIRPDLVDLSRKPAGWPSGRWIGTDFPLTDGRMPTRELGEKIVKAQVARLGEMQRDLLATHVPRADWKAPSQSDVDAIWDRFWRAANRYLVCNVTLGEYMAKQSLTFPGWEALGE
ncbi:MAG: creatininase family protein [Planctomycetota bacterium]|nr:creatininase family protein [Planctomycetota bacterium]